MFDVLDLLVINIILERKVMNKTINMDKTHNFLKLYTKSRNAAPHQYQKMNGECIRKMWYLETTFWEARIHFNKTYGRKSFAGFRLFHKDLI